jgi:KUP system potassium uptake protein
MVPPALLANLRHNESLHESIVVLSITTDDRPRVHRAERDHVTRHGLGFVELELRYGFVERPRPATDLQNLLIDGVTFDPDHTTFFLGRERIEVTDRPGMARWRERLYAYLSRNSGDPSVHFQLPPEHCVDIGTHVDI